jgi:competence ComEA-like helix-hairpin-helix protein
MPLQDLVPHFPPGFLHPTESIGSYLPILVNLPLMDVVMRIPPDLLALRPDQKDVDASVINMADPFTEEILREQAQAAQRQTQTNIIDESQVPATEEFVPRDQAPARKSFIPPTRTAPMVPISVQAPTPTPAMPAPTPSAPAPVAAMPPAPMPAATAPGMPPPPVPGMPPPPPAPVRHAAMPPPVQAPSPNSTRTTAIPTPVPSMPLPPPVNKFPTPPSFPRSGGIPPVPSVVKANSPIPPPAPNAASRTISASGRLPTPTRATTPIGRAQAAVTSPVMLSDLRPGQTLPAAPVTRETTSLPMPPRPASAGPVPQTPQPPLRPTSPVPVVTPPVPPPAAPLETSPEPEPMTAGSEPGGEPAPSPAPTEASFPKPGEPDAAANELQRLAALAMQEFDEEKPTETAPGEESPTEAAPTESKATSAPEPAPAPPEAKAPEAQPPPAPAEESFVLGLQPIANQTRSFGSKSITAPMPTLAPSAPEPKPAPSPEAAPEEEPAAALALNLNSCTAEDLLHIPGCTRALAESIVRYRTKIGSFKQVEDLLNVPGMNGSAYSNLTGENPPQSGVSQSLADLLGFPPEQKVSLKDVTDRIGCWPDVTGCVLSQSTGLSLVGSVPANLDRSAIVAFAPRMFEGVNKSFSEIAGKETDELIIPTSGTSFHIFRNGDLYMIILSRLPQMPDRHMKIARLVLAGLTQRPG